MKKFDAENMPMQSCPYLLTAEQIRVCEQFTMEQDQISALQLMERAGRACCKSLSALAGQLHTTSFIIFCGSGNNGGDGLVIARLLAEQHCTVHAVLCQTQDSHPTPSRQANLERWKQIVQTRPENTCTVYDETNPVEILSNTIVVDALFGIGLNKTVTGLYASVVRLINLSDAFTVSIDVPSGLFIDRHTDPGSPIVRANCTLTMQFNKLAFLLPECYPYCGEILIMDIGLLADEKLTVTRECLIADNVKVLFRPPCPYSHKGTFGHGLLIAGSAVMPGAAILSATAAMRGGIGKLTVHTAGQVARYLPGVLPEAILNVDQDESIVSNIDWDTLQPNINAIAIGPGLGKNVHTVNFVKDILHTVQAPVILDADALNILSANKTWLAFLPENSIMTPHYKEFERLAGPAANDFERIEKAGIFAQRYSIILILKGYHTLISLPDGRQFFNMTGNAGMATAGSGDVLTGLLLALLAQGYSPAATALLGVYLHGLAGDFAADKLSQQSMTASDISRFLGTAFRQITSTVE